MIGTEGIILFYPFRLLPLEESTFPLLGKGSL